MPESLGVLFLPTSYFSLHKQEVQVLFPCDKNHVKWLWILTIGGRLDVLWCKNTSLCDSVSQLYAEHDTADAGHDLHYTQALLLYVSDDHAENTWEPIT